MNSRVFSYVICIIASLATLNAARCETFVLPANGENIIGAVSSVAAKYEDTMIDIAREHGLGFDEIQQANPTVDPWLPGAGTKIILPTQFILPDAPHKGIVLNIAELRLYYYPSHIRGETAKVITYPVSVGRGDWRTPKGPARIIQKKINPTWTPPQSVREEHAANGDILPGVVPGGPDNPLGLYALKLNLPGYLIHSTNKPNGIGMRVTHGCVRLSPNDIQALFPMVKVGTSVEIIDQPYKAAWKGNVLYFEAHPPQKSDVYEQTSRPSNLTDVVRELIRVTRDHQGYAVNWDKAQDLAREGSGIPVPLESRQSDAQVSQIESPAIPAQ